MTDTDIKALIERLRDRSVAADGDPLLIVAAAALEALQAERDAARFAHQNGKSLAEDAIHAIRQGLTAAGVPVAAFIDDHVGNAIAQRDAAIARAEKAEAALRNGQK